MFAVVGERERDAQELAVRLRKTGDIGKWHHDAFSAGVVVTCCFISCAGSRGLKEVLAAMSQAAGTGSELSDMPGYAPIEKPQ